MTRFSPYLFIIAIDTLQKVLELATMDGALSPLRGRNAKLRLSLYADDAVIFLNPIRSEVRALFEILVNFGKATGLKLNLQKCTVAPSGAPVWTWTSFWIVFRDSESPSQ